LTPFPPNIEPIWIGPNAYFQVFGNLDCAKRLKLNLIIFDGSR
jgi:hypothetical protein